MLRRTIVLPLVAGASAITISVAAPAVADEDNIYGLLTPDENAEIWENGWRNCVALDDAAEAAPPLTSDDVKAVVDGYISQGWDWESAADIVWESVEGGCAGYLPQVEIAMRSYGPTW